MIENNPLLLYLHHLGTGLHWSEPLEAACFILGWRVGGGWQGRRVEGVS